MSGTFQANLGNAMQERVIDAARGAGFTVPDDIAALHSDNASDYPNQWHVTLGLVGADADGRGAALNGLTRVNDWANDLRDRPDITTALRVNRRFEQQVQSVRDLAPMAKMRVAMAVDDALQLHLLAQVYREPFAAQKLLRAEFRASQDPVAMADQLAETPSAFGDLVGKRVAGIDGPNRRHAMTVLRTQIIHELHQAGMPNAVTVKTVRLATPDQPLPNVDRRLLAFDDAVTRFNKAYMAMIAGGIVQEIAGLKSGDASPHQAGGANRPSRR